MSYMNLACKFKVPTALCWQDINPTGVKLHFIMNIPTICLYYDHGCFTSLMTSNIYLVLYEYAICREITNIRSSVMSEICT